MFYFRNSRISDDTKGAKNMKKLKIIPFFFIAVLLLLTACSSKQRAGETEEDRFQDEREYLIMANLTESDKGIYGVEWGEEYTPIFFVDKTTGKKNNIVSEG